MGRMPVLLLPILCITPFLLGTVGALADPFPTGNADKGKPLVEASCVACHASRFGGDGSWVYRRPERTATTPAKLLSRIQVCNTVAKAGWFPEQEVDVAAYLNRSYYHFK